MRAYVRPLVLTLSALGAVTLVGAPAALAGEPGASASAAAKPLVRIVGPTQDRVVRTGRVRLVVETRPGARLKRVEVNGVAVTGRLRAAGGSLHVAQLTVGRELRHGVNDVTAVSSGTASQGTYDAVRFVVAKRDDRLLTDGSVHTRGADAPVRARVRTAPGTTLTASVNGRRADGAFWPVANGLSGRLGANDGLRHGDNRITIVVHRTSASQRQSTYDIERRTVRIPSDAPIASAGRDRVVAAGSTVRLDARKTIPAAGAGRPAFRWTLVDRPKGSTATLRQAATAQPTLAVDRPGTYRARVVAQGGGSSSDTVTLVAGDDVPPIGRTFSTTDDQRDIRLGGEAIRGPACCLRRVNYVVLDRRTLQVQKAGSVYADPDGLRSLGTIVDGYSRGQNSLVALNWLDLEGVRSSLAASRDELARVLGKIGAEPLTNADKLRLSDKPAPGSAIGIAGGAPGGAFVRLPYREVPECPNGRCDSYATVGDMSGWLRRSGATGKYDFVFTDSVDIDTAVDGNPVLGRGVVAIGGAQHTVALPQPGSAGFFLLRLNPYTLEVRDRFGYATNGANGDEAPEQAQQMADDLAAAAADPTRPLVVVQSYGEPHGQSEAWGKVALALERLGGTRQVFNGLNTTDPRPLNGESADARGGYAFVGRADASAPLAETSEGITGRPGRLRGLLMRSRDGGYEPMLVGPTGTSGQAAVNAELTRIVNEPAVAFPAFTLPDGTPIDGAHAQAVQSFLGGPEVASLCSASVAVCDVRRSYYESYRAPWASIQDDLTNAARTKCPGAHQAFTEAECRAIASQLRDEISMVAKVTTYLGPNGLQQPFGAAGVAALADVGRIAQEIKESVNPPPADNTAATVLTGISYFLRLGAFLGKPADQVAAGLSGAFAVAGYFTRADGSPNLVGAEVTASASRLGPELADRYQRAGDSLDDIGRILVSDYGKLRTVAARTNAAPGPGELDWRLDSVGKAYGALRQATRQMIYERLVPLAYPRLYDLGPRTPNARIWYCDGGIGYDKRLFGTQVDDAQLIARFPRETPYTTLVTAAAVRATGRLRGARIPGPPKSVTDALFNEPGDDGLGLSKLEFFAPRNGFSYFPSEPQLISKEDRRGNWSSLSMFPINTNYRIQCTDVPSPPGNSG